MRSLRGRDSRKEFMKYNLDIVDKDKFIGDFLDEMSQEDLDLYNTFNALRADGAYDGKVLALFTRQGGDAQVLGRIKVLDFECNSAEGSTIRVQDMATNRTLILDHVPQRLFEYPVFAFTATVSLLRYTYNKENYRTLAYPMLLKTKHSIQYGTKDPDAVYIEPERDLHKFYRRVA